MQSMPPECSARKKLRHKVAGPLIGLVLVGMGTPVWAAQPQHEVAPPGSLELSAQTRGMLRAEMREISAAAQALVPAIAGARWDEVARIAEQIAASFVLEQQLTAAQREELERALPARFVELDRAFHITAQRLAAAARQGERELVTFRFYQLVSACTGCHAQYARAVFPGYEAPATAPEHHAH